VGGPEVEGVALGAALGVEAAEDALVQVDRERAVPVVGFVVQRAGPAALRPGASQRVEVAEVLQDIGDRHPAADCGEVERWVAARRRGGGLRGRGRVPPVVARGPTIPRGPTVAGSSTVARNSTVV